MSNQSKPLSKRSNGEHPKSPHHEWMARYGGCKTLQEIIGKAGALSGHVASITSGTSVCRRESLQAELARIPKLQNEVLDLRVKLKAANDRASRLQRELRQETEGSS